MGDRGKSWGNSTLKGSSRRSACQCPLAEQKEGPGQTGMWEVVEMRLAVGGGGVAQTVRDCRSWEIQEINESERRVLSERGSIARLVFKMIVVLLGYRSEWGQGECRKMGRRIPYLVQKMDFRFIGGKSRLW